jgi:hypothetical protein
MLGFFSRRVLGSRILKRVTVSLAFSAISFRQIDSSTLRSAFGPPLQKSTTQEVFRIRPGFEVNVHYSLIHQVCRLDIAPGLASKEEVDEALATAVPLSKRGKRWNQFMEMDGLFGFANTYYEKVVVTEDVFPSKVINKNPGASIVFKDKACGWKAGQDTFDHPPRS